MRPILTALILWLVGCSETVQPSLSPQANQYVYYEKWKAADDEFESWLKDKPAELVIRSYARTYDSMEEPEKQLYDEYVYRFDKQGHCIYRRRNVYQDTTEAFYSYTDKGYQGREDQLNFRGSKRTNLWEQSSSPVDSHSFRTLSYENDTLNYYTLTSFEPEGKVVVTYPPAKVTMESQQYWYVNDRLVKTVSISEGQADTTIYQRNEKGVLQAMTDPKNKHIYECNEQGDVVLHRRFINNKIYSETHVRYQYDAHGNWTKRLLITEPQGSKGFITGELEIRKILY